MSDDNTNQPTPDASSETPASPQASNEQPVQAQPPRPVFPENVLLTEAARRMEEPTADTRSAHAQEDE